jgi:hypothetical protein
MTTSPITPAKNSETELSASENLSGAFVYPSITGTVFVSPRSRDPFRLLELTPEEREIFLFMFDNDFEPCFAFDLARVLLLDQKVVVEAGLSLCQKNLLALEDVAPDHKKSDKPFGFLFHFNFDYLFAKDRSVFF